MHNQDLGRVAVVARGAYDPSAEYERLDAVSYNGSSYLVRKHCQGVEPAEGEYYMLMAQAGDSTAANAAAEKALAAAERADSASARADDAAGNAEQQASAARAAADSANAAAAAAQDVVDSVAPDINQLKDDLQYLGMKYPFQVSAKLSLYRSLKGTTYDVSSYADAIKEIRLYGTDILKEYYAFCQNTSSASRIYIFCENVELAIVNIPLVTSSGYVKYDFAEMNSSGISGYVIADLSLLPTLLGSYDQYDASYSTTGISKICYVYANDVNNLDGRLKVLEPKPIEEPLDNLVLDGGMCNIFNSICCIGDSLTAGVFNTTYPEESAIDNRNYSYPAYLSRTLGIVCHNCGSGGSTANNTTTKGWLNRAELEQNQFWKDANKSDAYIIALGANDISAFGVFDGNISTDIDLDNYENNANTSVGGYSKIIQRIKEIQPKAKVFCVTIPIWRNRYTDEQKIARTNANIAIRNIANLLNCYVIDLEKYYIKEGEINNFLSKYVNGSHRNALGYKELSVVYASYIDFIIRSNINDFRNVQFIGSEYDFS